MPVSLCGGVKGFSLDLDSEIRDKLAEFPKMEPLDSLPKQQVASTIKSAPVKIDQSALVKSIPDSSPSLPALKDSEITAKYRGLIDKIIDKAIVAQASLHHCKTEE